MTVFFSLILLFLSFLITYLQGREQGKKSVLNSLSQDSVFEIEGKFFSLKEVRENDYSFDNIKDLLLNHNNERAPHGN